MLNFLKLIVRYHLLYKGWTAYQLLQKSLPLIVHNHFRTTYFLPRLIPNTNINHNKRITFAKNIGTREVLALK